MRAESYIEFKPRPARAASQGLPMNRISIVSDIHGNAPALEAVEADIRRREPDLVVNLGDHISGPLWPAETLAELKGRDWVHIRGNHDRVVGTLPPERLGPSDRFAHERIDEAGRKWLLNLPPVVRLEYGLTPDSEINVNKTGDSVLRVDLLDAVSIARKVAGLDP